MCAGVDQQFDTRYSTLKKCMKKKRKNDFPRVDILYFSTNLITRAHFLDAKSFLTKSTNIYTIYYTYIWGRGAFIFYIAFALNQGIVRACRVSSSHEAVMRQYTL